MSPFFHLYSIPTTETLDLLEHRIWGESLYLIRLCSRPNCMLRFYSQTQESRHQSREPKNRTKGELLPDKVRAMRITTEHIYEHSISAYEVLATNLIEQYTGKKQAGLSVVYKPSQLSHTILYECLRRFKSSDGATTSVRTEPVRKRLPFVSEQGFGTLQHYIPSSPVFQLQTRPTGHQL